VTLVASVEATGNEPRLAVEVRDTGIGISPEHLEGIFRPFDQADNSITRNFGGTGLGLTISRHIAQALGGDIDVTSQQHVGSVFRVTLETGPLDGVPIDSVEQPEALPVQPEAKAAETEYRGCGSGTSSMTDLSGIRILLCEDGATNRQLLELVLEGAGATVTSVENGQLGVDAVNADLTAFDLILMDMQMPVLDGYSATRTLRDSGWTKPIIALTAHAMKADEERCLAAGCSGYETKPVDIDRLLVTVCVAARGADHPCCSNPLNDDNAKCQLTADSNPTANSAPATSEPMLVELSVASTSIRSTHPIEVPDFAQLVSDFLKELPGRIDQMRTSLQNADCDSLREHAHWLKGAGGSAGFGCLTEPCHQLEQAAVDGQLPTAETLLAEIEELSQRLEDPLACEQPVTL
jgi:CheY-like chemotaxis protein